ncbi:MAG: hypothetical protein R3A52_32665 [Polyangiales bacterium]
MPAYDTRASRREVIELREDGTHAIFSPPNDGLFLLSGRGDRLFGYDFRAAWSWDGARWTRLPALDQGGAVGFVFASDGGAWALGGGVRRPSATRGSRSAPPRLPRSGSGATRTASCASLRPTRWRWSGATLRYAGSMEPARWRAAPHMTACVDYVAGSTRSARVACSDGLCRVRGEEAERVAWPAGSAAVRIATACPDVGSP